MSAAAKGPTLSSVLACPDCGRALPGEECACGRSHPVRDGIRVLLPADADPRTRRFYESDDERRHGYEAMPERERECVREFLSRLPDDRLVVELGSGRCLFAGWHPGLVLTDYSHTALARFGCGERVQLDAQRLPFRDRSVADS